MQKGKERIFAIKGEQMEIIGTTRVCGLIGNPVEHTLSPLIHNTISEKLQIPLVYVPFHVEQEGVEAAVRGAYELNVLGLNVTVPHKSAVIAHLKEIDPLAEKIGAVNTLVRVEGGYKGYNTDILGLYRAMKEADITIENQETVLLGAGGAARAAAFLLAEKGAKKVYLLNRSLEKADQLAREINDSFERDCICPMKTSEYEKLPSGKLTVIQGTSVGLYPNIHDVVIEDPEFYKHVNKAYDLIYKPAETKFMKLVRGAGGKAENGLKMLLYQGITAYEYWNRLTVPEEIIQIVYDKLEGKVRV